ncbi:hypothetical protein ABW20_dc0103416 [Dactylellina cionopaga]|nr:hypothetical protein ABW20_dc0103416 [Dactylellina cionopaga]
MFSKNLLLFVSATFVALSQSLPTATTSSHLKSQNPYPAKEPYIHLISSPNPAIRIRSLLISRAVAAPSCTLDIECKTNSEIFSITLSDFINNYRNKGKNSPPLVYDSDGCSVPQEVADFFHIDKDYPYGYDFLNVCYRHDFGYRNFKLQNRFTEPNREKLDLKFKDDLLAQCTAQYPNAGIFHPVDYLNKEWCKVVAGVYFDFVRLCGRDNCTLEAAKAVLKKIAN